ncbi:MAG: domain containing rane protein [Bacillales bacterium]|jgi:acetoin utilization protein AcuB|nr:domain containing rane protein [Bacillales bacterium]
MLVEKMMSKDVIVLSLDSSVHDAITLFDLNKIKHLPVVDLENNLLGIVTDKEIKEVCPSIFCTREHTEIYETKITNIMKKTFEIGHPLDFVEDVAELFLEKKLTCLPIVKQGKLMGIITETDLLQTLVKLTGAHKPSTQLEIKVQNNLNDLPHIISLLHSHCTEVISILTFPDTDINYKILSIRINTMNPIEILSSLKSNSYNVLNPSELIEGRFEHD